MRRLGIVCSIRFRLSIRSVQLDLAVNSFLNFLHHKIKCSEIIQSLIIPLSLVPTVSLSCERKKGDYRIFDTNTLPEQ